MNQIYEFSTKSEQFLLNNGIVQLLFKKINFQPTNNEFLKFIQFKLDPKNGYARTLKVFCLIYGIHRVISSLSKHCELHSNERGNRFLGHTARRALSLEQVKL